MKILSLLAAGLLLAGTVGVAASGAATEGTGATAPTADAMIAGSVHGWEWPLSPKPGVARPFDPPLKPWMSGHRGVDLRAAVGAPVLAPEAGTVSFVGTVVDRQVLTLDHGNGLRSTFEPVSSSLEPGSRVTKGQVLGSLDPGHCGPAACLHWGVRQGEVYLNPLSFVMDLRPSVLLPLRDAQGVYGSGVFGSGVYGSGIAGLGAGAPRHWWSPP